MGTLLGGAALAGLLAASVALAAGAAAQRRWFFVPASITGGFPDWLAGPLHRLDWSISPQQGAQLLVAMSLCYLVALACARALPAPVALGAIVLAHVAFLLAPPLFSADVFGYVDYARLAVVHGLDPYHHGAAAAVHDPVFRYVRWHDVFTPYGPLFTVASFPLAWLSVPVALWTCKALAALLSLACVALVWQVARRRETDPVFAVVLVGLNPVLLAYGVGGAHNDFLLLALALGAILLALLERPGAAGAGAALALGVKASGGIVLPFLVLGTRRRRTALAGACVAAVAVFAIGVAAFGADTFGFARQIGQQQELVARYSVPSQVAALLGFASIPGGLRAAFTVALVAALGGLLWATWRRRIDWIAAAGWATLALLLATAWFVPWYVVWLLPLAAVARDRRLLGATLLFCAYVVATRVTYQLM